MEARATLNKICHELGVCGVKLLTNPPGEEVPREELTKFALKLVAVFRGQAAGIIKVPKLEGWTKEELEGTADLMLADLRQGRPEVLARLRKLYQETGGEPFEEIHYGG